MTDLILAEIIEQKIYLIRDQKVMLDSDLAKLYGVTTKQLNQQVKRNKKRFPEDFAFRLNREEDIVLRSQFVTSNNSLTSQIAMSKGRGGRRTLPYAFTEQGVAMLSSVLNSDRAVQVNIQIIRTFIKLRKLLSAHADLLKKVENLEKNYDRQFRIVFQIIRELENPPAGHRYAQSIAGRPEKGKKQIGFKPE